jgi:methionyl-tRNA synthetase
VREVAGRLICKSLGRTFCGMTFHSRLSVFADSRELRFHAIYFPAILLALSLSLPKKLLTHAHWTSNQKKMSKSLGNVADPIEAMDTFGIDGVRYYMARVGGRFQNDVGGYYSVSSVPFTIVRLTIIPRKDWSSEQADKHLDEIRSLLGNFFLRIMSQAIQSKLSLVTDPKPTLSEMSSSTYLPGDTAHEHNRRVLVMLQNLGSSVRSSLECLEVAEALDQIMLCLKQVCIFPLASCVCSISTLFQANAAMTSIRPWASDPTITYASYTTSLETLRIAGLCLQPIIPSTSNKLLDALGVMPGERTWEFTKLGRGKVENVRGVALFEGKRKVSREERKIPGGRGQFKDQTYPT